MLPGRQKVDISSFSEQERELFQKYGKVPSSKGLLANKLKERKYFDSGDYALSKAGVAPQHTVGTAIPSPADIPHASPPNNPAASTSPGSAGFAGGQSGSPTSGGGAGPFAGKGDNAGVGMPIGSPSKGQESFGGRFQ
ncbi:camp-regulated phospho protein/endosulfine conserved region-domain-containing protein [Leucosporidium creatinivorum]|uniref:mRNA stability protein n=1 Tax=Leucosporidium creatinivorum TaxID=106004 RepID=A0A1Y2FY72_9BASI|nr:camp-regulated phospho protein/endosulfine conserved region-domain-containing protein [Leucosporidium creatinivorum]